MKPDIKRVVVLTHGEPEVAQEQLIQSLTLFRERGIQALVPGTEFEKHGALLEQFGGVGLVEGARDLDGVGLCLVLGGDGTMLRAFHLTRDRCIPVAGVNLGRVGFLTTVDKDDLAGGLARLLDGRFTEYPLLGLEATVGDEVYRATNDVVVGKGKQAHACLLSLTINGVTFFEVQCDGVVVGTPAGSSAYSLAAGGPLLGISVNAYVISLIAAHAVGVRPVVAAPGDLLEIINIGDSDCAIDVDGDRLAMLEPGTTARINTTPGMTTLALLEGDSLYHHFRDRLL
ncbi:MAG: NAD(+)/NADH kinase [Thermoleophilia bacterium]|nr:NAD(+)/NADH kinase [Thermoleophilia bacterium]